MPSEQISTKMNHWMPLTIYWLVDSVGRENVLLILMCAFLSLIFISWIL